MFSLLFILFVLPFGAYAQTKTMTATFAGGCFWCMQPPFENIKGVEKVVAGYAGGTGLNPVYEDYARKGYIEAVQVIYDPAIISYAELLDIFWRQIDPTDPDGQFCDRGPQYRAGIFFDNEEQKKEAQVSKERLAGSGRFSKPVVTELIKYTNFYPAEGYHQDYHTKNPIQYKFYRFSCGRDQFLNKYWNKSAAEKAKAGASDPTAPPNDWAEWKKPNAQDLKARLTPMQYKVTQENGTEPAYRNAYWDNHADGIYVDIVSGEPLFSSIDKYDSKTGWPSFTRPLEPKNVVEKEDRAWFMSRTEVLSAHAGSHLGHVFTDGPAPTGLRYCMNSAALRFVPKEDLEKEGYGQYKKLFEKATRVQER